MDDKDEPRSWHSISVSWGQFVIALALAGGGFIAWLFADRILVDHRITVLEQGYAFLLKIEERAAMEYTAMRSALDGRLMDIQRQLVILTLELTKHQASAVAKPGTK